MAIWRSSGRSAEVTRRTSAGSRRRPTRRRARELEPRRRDLHPEGTPETYPRRRIAEIAGPSARPGERNPRSSLNPMRRPCRSNGPAPLPTRCPSVAGRRRRLPEGSGARQAAAPLGAPSTFHGSRVRCPGRAAGRPVPSAGVSRRRSQRSTRPRQSDQRGSMTSVAFDDDGDLVSESFTLCKESWALEAGGMPSRVEATARAGPARDAAKRGQRARSKGARPRSAPSLVL